MTCPACQIGAVLECCKPNGVRCGSKKVEIVNAKKTKVKITGDPRADKTQPTRSHKEDAAVKDAASTGRKRAAILLPWANPGNREILCEWAGLKYAGGGRNPIVGCTGNLATNRHHGPDKNTLNNSRENPRNLHGICPWCHNRWHAKNDIGYKSYLEEIGGPQALPPHDMETKASAEELVQANKSQYERSPR